MDWKEYAKLLFSSQGIFSPIEDVSKEKLKNLNEFNELKLGKLIGMQKHLLKIITMRQEKLQINLKAFKR